MSKNRQKHALVTGVSRGIGSEISKKLLSDGFRVTGTARSDTAPRGVREDPVLRDVVVDPHGRHVWNPVRHQRREVRERLPLE
ncbi:MAG: SDR family NAD(P)-dependent oxidoreductase, partial [Balneolaceae bacterium]|nr:SDR family NAD(P)-dependent oxidoreductase [Balneolaceae bacterium]